MLFTEGWPKNDRKGRPIGDQAVRVVFTSGGIEIHENGKPLWESDKLDLPFDEAFLYLQMSSHSNYRAREVFFNDVTVSSSSSEKK